MITFHHREFELAVREDIKVFDRPVEESDLPKVERLDCSNFDFADEDLDTLQQCVSLEELDISIGRVDLSFLSAFPKLKQLWLEYWGNAVDFRAFSGLQELENLFVSGGDISSIPFLHTEALTSLGKLQDLWFHEFGSVDLRFLEEMPWLEAFGCGWANEVTSIASIGKLEKLQSLTLIDLQMDNLDFLDALPDTMELDLCADEVREGINPEKLRRFQRVSVCEMTVKGEAAGILMEPDSE